MNYYKIYMLSVVLMYTSICSYYKKVSFGGIEESPCVPVLSYVLLSQLLLYGWTDTDETLPSCSMCILKIKEENPCPNYFKGDNK